MIVRHCKHIHYVWVSDTDKVKHNLSRKRDHFSWIAKFVNIYRASANPKKMFDSMVLLYSHAIAQKLFSRLPPRPLRGRWGSISLIEVWLLKIGFDTLRRVFFHAIVEPTSRRTRGKDAAAVTDLDMIDEQCESHSARMGRWTTDVHAEIQKSENWKEVQCSNITRGPATHVEFWLQSHNGGRGCLCELVCRKATAATLLSSLHVFIIFEIEFPTCKPSFY